MNENCVVIINEVWYLIKFELKLRENEVENCNCLCDLLYILNGCLKLLGYDFSKYVIDVDIFLWFLWLSFRGFFISLWLSVDGDDVGWLLSFEGFCDE